MWVSSTGLVLFPHCWSTTACHRMRYIVNMTRGHQVSGPLPAPPWVPAKVTASCMQMVSFSNLVALSITRDYITRWAVRWCLPYGMVCDMCCRILTCHCGKLTLIQSGRFTQQEAKNGHWPPVYGLPHCMEECTVSDTEVRPVCSIYRWFGLYTGPHLMWPTTPNAKLLCSHLVSWQVVKRLPSPHSDNSTIVHGFFATKAGGCCCSTEGSHNRRGGGNSIDHCYDNYFGSLLCLWQLQWL